MGLEYERKYAASKESLLLIQKDCTETPTLYSMETIYYDTVGGDLSSRHITLRRRLENGVSVCTLKTPTGTAARGEFQVECATIEEALPILCKLSGYGQLRPITADGVIPICGAKFARQAYRVNFGDSVLELALDEGILQGGGKTLPLFEAEVELIAGAAQDADLYGTILAAKYGLREETKSKFRRALALAKGDL